MAFGLLGIGKIIGKGLLSKATKKVGRVIAGRSKTGNTLLAGGAGLAAGGITSRVLPAVGTAGRFIGRAAGSPLGRAVLGGAAGGAIVGYLDDGSPVYGRRRRGRGFTSRDIRQTRRMLRLIKDMQGCIPKRKC